MLFPFITVKTAWYSGTSPLEVSVSWGMAATSAPRELGLIRREHAGRPRLATAVRATRAGERHSSRAAKAKQIPSGASEPPPQSARRAGGVGVCINTKRNKAFTPTSWFGWTFWLYSQIRLCDDLFEQTDTGWGAVRMSSFWFVLFILLFSHI